MSAARNGVAHAAGATVYVQRYKRVSSDEQKDKGLSLPFQETETTRYVLARANDGWVEDGIYEDVLRGTRNERPGYQALLSRARELRRQGKAVVIVVFRTDRFGRRLSERIRAWEEFKELQIELHSVYEGGKQDRLAHNVRALLSEEEVQALSQRVSAARAYVVERGWRPVGRAPWGYRWRDATGDERGRGAPHRVLELHPDEASYVREAWQRRAEGGLSIHAVGLWMAGLPDAARGGRTLDYATARVMFRAPVYVGRPDIGDVDVLARPRGNWPPLVDDATWTSAVALATRAARQPAQASGRFLLTGLLRCWRCGHRMDGRSFLPKASRERGTGRRRETYRCISRMRGASGGSTPCLAEVPRAAVEALVLERVGGLLDALVQPETVAQIEAVERAQHARAALAGETTASRLGAETARLNRARKLLAAAAEAKLLGELGSVEYAVVRDKQMLDLAAAETAIAEIRGRSLSASPVPLSELLGRVSGWREALGEAGNLAAARSALGGLIEMIVPARGGRRWSRAWDVNVVWTPAGSSLKEAAETLEEYPVGTFGKTNYPTGYSSARLTAAH
jgi:DNA invertase Pin-like site-specific DNA recombinase